MSDLRWSRSRSVRIALSQDCSTFGDPSQIWLTTSLASFIQSYLLTPQSSHSDCQHILEWVTIWSPIVTTLQLATPVSNIFTNTTQIHWIRYTFTESITHSLNTLPIHESATNSLNPLPIHWILVYSLYSLHIHWIYKLSESSLKGIKDAHLFFLLCFSLKDWDIKSSLHVF